MNLTELSSRTQKNSSLSKIKEQKEKLKLKLGLNKKEIITMYLKVRVI